MRKATAHATNPPRPEYSDEMPPGWTVKSITAGTADLMTVGDEAASLEGNAPVRVVLTDKQGTFRVRGLPPGQYVAAAATALEEGAQWDPAFQAAVRDARGSQRFTLSEGQIAVLTLDLMP